MRGPPTGSRATAGESDVRCPKTEAFFLGVHERFPLVAVVFQQGQFFAGKSLLALDDASLVARLAPCGGPLRRSRCVPTSAADQE